MRKTVLALVSLLLVVGAIVVPSDQVTARFASSSGADASLAATVEEEKALINDILDELKKARELAGDSGFWPWSSDDGSEVPGRLEDIQAMVNELSKLIAAGEEDRAMKYKLVIAGKLEDLIGYLPLAPTTLTTAAAATGAANPLYDEVVRIRAKIQKLIELERTVELVPPEEIARPPEMEKLIVYSVKYVCGPSFGDFGVQRGSYSTAINVHNPHDATIYLYKKAVIALREDEERGRISKFHRVALKADEAIDIDCVDIWRLLYPTPDVEALRSPATLSSADVARLTAVTPVSSMIRFITGFVVIYSTAPLDVVAVYTGSTPVGFSLDVEYVSPSTHGMIPWTPPEEKECPDGCVCLTREEATEYGLELCGGKLMECGRNEDGETLYCWERSAASECPDGCFCMTQEKAAELGYIACDEQKIKCGTDSSGRDLLCFERPPFEQCPTGCFCTTEEKAKEAGYVLCNGKRIKCGADADGRDLFCYERAPTEECPDDCFCTTEEKAKRYGYVLCYGKKIVCGKDSAGNDLYCYQEAEELCPDGCFCITPEEAIEKGYFYCGGQVIKCGTDASGRDLFCYQRTEAQCPGNCLCMTEGEAKRKGYVYCDGVRIECGVDAAGNKLYCYEPRG
ncbi:MAG: hypothetical protein KAU10_09475 [Dehalococcoidia bacterium]|nr:hypothetical protein [Dehalococcoidia bacterium]